MPMTDERFEEIRAKVAARREAEAGAGAASANAEPDDELITYDSADALIAAALGENPD